MFIFDAHLDLSMNALEWNRDLTRSLAEIRENESGMSDKAGRGRGTVSLPEMRRGAVGLCVATQIARYVRPGNTLPGWRSPEQAWAQTQGQLAWYRAMEERGEMVQLRDRAGLDRHRALWDGPAVDAPIGYILSLEGADSLITVDHLERSYGEGLRAVGPAHYGPGTYAQGTDASGGIGRRGRELLKEMERLSMILDVTHLCEESFWEALDLFNGAVWASHSNCRVFVDHNRQLSDEQIRELIGRDAVIGVALDAWMMVPGWVRGESNPQSMGVSLRQMIDNIDHICQLAGDAHHVGIGTDLDGGFGKEQCPADLDSIADLERVPAMLRSAGYREEDVEAIMNGNWIAFLERAWAE